MVQRKKVSDLIGKTFNRLTVSKYLGKGLYNKHHWECVCVCGGKTILNTSRIISKNATVSCGCLRKETMKQNRADPTRHGLTLTEPNLYAIYHGMLQRCYNPTSQRWKYYGGKSVVVCEEWLTGVEAFVEWATNNGYVTGLSLDRIKSDRSYSPDNCQWVTVSENSRRMNVTRRIAKAL